MKTDLDIIKLLEKELNITFEAKFDGKPNWSNPHAQYALNESEQVIELRLYNLDLTEVPTSLFSISQLATVRFKE